MINAKLIFLYYKGIKEILKKEYACHHYDEHFRKLVSYYNTTFENMDGISDDMRYWLKAKVYDIALCLIHNIPV